MPTLGGRVERSGGTVDNRAYKKAYDACDVCRERKVKCGGERPQCAKCRQLNEAAKAKWGECKYNIANTFIAYDPTESITRAPGSRTAVTARRAAQSQKRPEQRATFPTSSQSRGHGTSQSRGRGAVTKLPQSTSPHRNAGLSTFRMAVSTTSSGQAAGGIQPSRPNIANPQKGANSLTFAQMPALEGTLMGGAQIHPTQNIQYRPIQGQSANSGRQVYNHSVQQNVSPARVTQTYDRRSPPPDQPSLRPTGSGQGATGFHSQAGPHGLQTHVEAATMQNRAMGVNAGLERRRGPQHYNSPGLEHPGTIQSGNYPQGNLQDWMGIGQGMGRQNASGAGNLTDQSVAALNLNMADHFQAAQNSTQYGNQDQGRLQNWGGPAWPNPPIARNHTSQFETPVNPNIRGHATAQFQAGQDSNESTQTPGYDPAQDRSGYQFGPFGPY
ncbi:hypothetical protein P389DRAFT_187855 [Cystobasidium minutum MCA 4210]|uniref:uncharacterized protein n=1 Tax=Cystobasidium minutum MCA 4210 TaxID=1397322 RepID=UPI0034CE8311|eukprot:jgi/Rhomi1/187855/estExt_fgenesh1_pg.C_2_t10104